MGDRARKILNNETECVYKHLPSAVEIVWFGSIKLE
jgi:hypothetical protein